MKLKGGPFGDVKKFSKKSHSALVSSSFECYATKNNYYNQLDPENFV